MHSADLGSGSSAAGNYDEISVNFPSSVKTEKPSPRLSIFRAGHEVLTVMLSRISAKRRTSTTLFAEFDCGYTLSPYSQLTARPRESKNRSVSSGVKRESTSSGKPGCAPW